MELKMQFCLLASKGPSTHKVFKKIIFLPWASMSIIYLNWLLSFVISWHPPLRILYMATWTPLDQSDWINCLGYLWTNLKTHLCIRRHFVLIQIRSLAKSLEPAHVAPSTGDYTKTSVPIRDYSPRGNSGGSLYYCYQWLGLKCDGLMHYLRSQSHSLTALTTTNIMSTSTRIVHIVQIYGDHCVKTLIVFACKLLHANCIQ